VWSAQGKKGRWDGNFPSADYVFRVLFLGDGEGSASLFHVRRGTPSARMKTTFEKLRSFGSRREMPLGTEAEPLRFIHSRANIEPPP
jgi:hypothetical protein